MVHVTYLVRAIYRIVKKVHGKFLGIF
ncbi:hypothetical protein FWK35_00026408 [Aphis craccivora]|uniref:Uncharacterized protein n=1 Tax=Aphis craccivora TaxID=307492 RepID=A0A6G0YPY0_APHCR|nr:hypothetical protein FWK35_00026408 [Aphis craccivora]